MNKNAAAGNGLAENFSDIDCFKTKCASGGRVASFAFLMTFCKRCVCWMMSSSFLSTSGGTDKKQALRPRHDFLVTSAEGYHADDKLSLAGLFGYCRIQQAGCGAVFRVYTDV
ncbi:MAG: hypothetical protein ACYC6Q_12500, partial [Syntrophales bacterium]